MTEITLTDIQEEDVVLGVGAGAVLPTYLRLLYILRSLAALYLTVLTAPAERMPLAACK